MNRSVQVLFFFAAAFLSGAGTAGEVPDVNAELSNAYRSDLTGPEMWTVGVGGDYRDDPYLSNMSVQRWRQPRLGLDGALCITHELLLADVLRPVVREGGVVLRFDTVRNRWTPAFRDSWYRSVSRAREDEHPKVGDTVVRERKCITRDNVFVAETTVKNTGRSARFYDVSLFVDGRVTPNGLWTFETTSLCKATRRHTFAAIETSFVGTNDTFVLEPHGTHVFRYVFAISPDSEASARAKARTALADPDPFAANAAVFNGWLAANAPDLTLRGDPDVARLYWYRWFVVWRGIHEARRAIADHEYPRRTIYESPNDTWCDCVIGLPVPMQVQEAAWMRDGSVVRDHLLNWAEGVRGYRGYIQFTAVAAERYLDCHPDRALAERILPALSDDALRRAGDGSRLPTMTNSWEAGAEYQPNFYQYTEPHPWDYRQDREFHRGGKNPDIPYPCIVRLDNVAYIAGDLLACSRLAASLGDAGRSERLAARAETLLELVRTRHWDEKLGLFLASDAKTGRLCDRAACYDSFAPYLWNLVSDKTFDRAFDKFCDPAWFWDDFAITTAAKTCPMYSDCNAITGPYLATPSVPHPYDCCWNGPLWHYADSLAAEAFGCAARRDPKRRPAWLAFFRSWTDSHFAGGDRASPRAAEHFRAEDGVPCGTMSDYFHSAWIDPLIRYYCGVGLDRATGKVTFEPFYSGDFTLGPVVLGGRAYRFEQKAGRRTVTHVEKE